MHRKIMYIDDDEINVDLFRIVFSKKYEVLTGYSGEEGLKLLASHPDVPVIISDMKMPGMNGIEFIRKAVSEHGSRNCFLLTGYGINTEIQEAIDTGVILKCFNKPLNKEEIEAAIDSLPPATP